MVITADVAAHAATGHLEPHRHVKKLHRASLVYSTKILTELTRHAKVEYGNLENVFFISFSAHTLLLHIFGTCYSIWLPRGHNLSYIYLQEKLRKALVEPVESLFDAAGQTTWSSIKNLYKRETEVILPEFFKALSGFEMESELSEGMVSKLRDYAQSIVENKAKEEASKVLMHMKERYRNTYCLFRVPINIITF